MKASTHSSHQHLSLIESSKARAGASTSASTSGDDVPASVLPPKKKRNRKAVSCRPCRKKKIKCDRHYPCSSCKIRGEVCEWVNAVPRKESTVSPLDLALEIDRLHKVVKEMGEKLGMTSQDIEKLLAQSVAVAKAVTHDQNHLQEGSDNHSASSSDGSPADPIGEQDQDAKDLKWDTSNITPTSSHGLLSQWPLPFPFPVSYPSRSDASHSTETTERWPSQGWAAAGPPNPNPIPNPIKKEEQSHFGQNRGVDLAAISTLFGMAASNPYRFHSFSHALSDRP